ncbi:hypothetical protein [Roseofilum capinflatum]|uniref:Uncharacterized protein n=1 Tax=Roseofilum capinflatum BLCC-M114 TaxID=3022440 RepID=A0ABT7B4L6_9CYAN|nr:hypothetical protein [Roseofilum capinflatum]MDJ1174121.1 hypothetical protein [Roseofilum capinflatum BLCC-M114]
MSENPQFEEVASIIFEDLPYPVKFILKMADPMNTGKIGEGSPLDPV